MSKELISVRDLPIPSKLFPIVEQVRNDIGQVESALTTITGRAAIIGFNLLNLKKEIGVKRGGSRKSTASKKTVVRWKELAEMVSGRGYVTCREYEKLAEGLADRCLALEVLIEKPLLSMSEDQQEFFLTKIRDLIDGHTLASLALGLGFAKQREQPGANNSEGKNGSDSVPLSPEQKAEQLTFKAMSSWLGTADPDKPTSFKPGSTGYRILSEAGIIQGPGGKPAEQTFLSLPKQSLEVLHQGLSKLTTLVESKVKETRS